MSGFLHASNPSPSYCPFRGPGLSDRQHARRGGDRRRCLAANAWGISSVVLWEIAKLSQLGRIRTNLNEAKMRTALSALHVWPIDLATAQTATELDFSGNPADELIAATSVVRDAPLLTRDGRILGSQRVPFV